MVLQITAEQQQALASGRRSRFARALHAQLSEKAVKLGYPTPSPQQADAWVGEALASGVTGETDVGDLCEILMEMSWAAERPAEAQARLTDPEVGGRLKVFQVRHAWRQHLKRT